MENSLERARFNMIQQQVRPWNVTDERVLAVLEETPRERFVPDAYQGLAYADIEAHIGAGETMLAPKVVGRMLQALNIQPVDRILEIGTGTGYITACLCRLGDRVVGLEIDPGLAEQAQANLTALGLHRFEVRVGDAFSGPVEGYPFDVIAVTGSLPHEEAVASLQEQLSLGGRLFAVIGEPPVMEAILVTRLRRDVFRRDALFETAVPRLENVPEPVRFVF
jgi:protein-L-isoaspartate(D-aspartate) O-methyltransferase